MRAVESRWVISDAPEPAEIAALARAASTSSLVARLLWIRGLQQTADARAFLQPRLQDLQAPKSLPDADRAADRIAKAVRDGERVGVFGDYDVDGMTGTAVLVRFLRLAGADPVWGVPDRSGDGYGLSPAAVDRLADKGARLIVTVDNGVAAHPAAERAQQRGLELIITDHHLPGETLPPAYAIVNPHRRDAGPYGRGLCGCAIAFKMAWAVAERLRGSTTGEKAARFKAFLRDAMGLVALATISDVVPLHGENRILVTAGLGSLRASEHPGICALLETSRLGSLPLTTEDVAFRIAPRLNAAGRVSKPDLVIQLLTTEDEKEAHRLARQLSDANAERRRIEKGVLEKAVLQAETRLVDSNRLSLVVHGDGWHRGVIGIVASRLVDRHQRPTVVVGFEDGIGRGSCRTPSHVDLHRALTDCGEHLSKYGGHAAAAGLEIDADSIDHFTDAFESAVQSQVGGSTPTRTLQIDAETDVDEWNLEIAHAVRRLEPFGAGNPEPLFMVRGASVAGKPRLMGQDGAHISFALKQTGGAIRVVGFRRADAYDLASSGMELDLVVTPMINEWRGTRTAELRLVDLRPSEA